MDLKTKKMEDHKVIRRQVLDEMIDEMPWKLNVNIEPYILTAMHSYAKKVIKNSCFIASVSKSNIAIGDYVWYNERIHKVQKIRFDDEFWKNKEIAIIDIQAKGTVDVSTKNLRYVC